MVHYDVYGNEIPQVSTSETKKNTFSTSKPGQSMEPTNVDMQSTINEENEYYSN
jgi:hypothetical protein